MTQQQEREQLQEKLLDLVRVNELGKQREIHSAAILSVIQEIAKAQSAEAVVDVILQGLQIITGYQEFAVLESKARQQRIWLATQTSHPYLSLSVWQQGRAFERTLNGECLSLFNPKAVTEFAEQEDELLELCQAALVFSFKTKLAHRIVLLLKQDKSFTALHQQAVEHLVPIAEQKLLNLEFEQKLYEMVAQRTQDLKLSQHRMAAFIDMSADWFWEVDEELKFSYVANPNHADGEHFQRLLLGKSILDTRSSKEKTRLNKWFNITRLVQQRKPLEQFEIELQLPECRAAWVKVCAAPFFNEKGIFAGYRGVATNITDYVSQSSELSLQIQRFSNQHQEMTTEPPTPALLEDKVRILLVDDCKSTQMITQLMLINLGYAVTVAEHGSQALALTELDQFALILMDLEMPDLSGEDVCRKMRERGLDMPILALSASSYGSRHAQTQAAGMDDYIEKPVRLNLLKSKLEAFLTESV